MFFLDLTRGIRLIILRYPVNVDMTMPEVGHVGGMLDDEHLTPSLVTTDKTGRGRERVMTVYRRGDVLPISVDEIAEVYV